jgi:hypothetical protein
VQAFVWVARFWGSRALRCVGVEVRGFGV